jgi:hypothetical protein
MADNKQDTSAPAQATATATATTTVEGDDAAPFVDDIIIWQEGLDAPRKLTQKALVALPKVPSSMMPPLNSLIKQGVTIAAIPTTSGIGASCYLVNLATLKRPSDEDA